MSKISSPYVIRSFVATVYVALIGAVVAFAQQGEIPPLPPEPAGVEAVPAESAPEEGEGRIVEERPSLYSVKRALHPFAWIEAGLRPLARLGDKFGPSAIGARDPDSTPREFGVKLWIQGLGSSSGFGPQVKPYHKNLLNRGIELEVPLTVTYKLYHSGRFRVNFPLVSGGGVDRLGFVVTGGYASRPSDRFFGIGNDTPDLEARFRSVTRDTGAGLEARLNGVWSARVETAYKSIGITEPRKSASALEVYQDAAIPGLSHDTGATMLSTTATVTRDTRTHPHLPDSGGLQTFEVGLNEGRTGGDFSYWSYRGEVQQFFPLSSDKRKVIALRATAETNRRKGGSVIPFFDLPAIGGSSTVRGFESRRFSDRSAMSVSAEFRYRIWRNFDWGLFVDAGQVAPEIGDFGLSRFHEGYGVRFIVRTAEKRAIFFDVAHSREEPIKFYIDFSPLF
jgi:hypothetical protein